MADQTPFAGISTEATLATVAKESTLATVAKEATLAAVATEVTLAAVAKEATLAGKASENTLAAVTELLNEIAVRLADIADSVGNLSPDVAGRIRVTAEVVANIATVATVTNQAQIGGLFANQHIVALTQINEYGLRANVRFS